METDARRPMWNSESNRVKNAGSELIDLDAHLLHKPINAAAMAVYNTSYKFILLLNDEVNHSLTRMQLVKANSKLGINSNEQEQA
jgi:hypothetical protein